MIQKNPIFVALDVDDKASALKLAHQVKPFVGGFKVGPRLMVTYGASLVEELSELGSVFVDNKYFDIPNTVEYAIRATAQSGAEFTTIHACCGAKALSAFAQLEREINANQPFRILVVTVLTSFTQETLPPNWSREPIAIQVKQLAKMSIEAGLTGLVCSPHEVDMLRSDFPEAFIVTPGIRRPGNETGDQARTLGPREALNAGASALVIGRPIYQAADPVEQARLFHGLVSGEGS